MPPVKEISPSSTVTEAEVMDITLSTDEVKFKRFKVPTRINRIHIAKKNSNILSFNFPLILTLYIDVFCVKFQEAALESKYKKLLQDLLFASHDIECKYFDYG